MKDFIAGFITGVGSCLMVIGTIMALSTDANAQHETNHQYVPTSIAVVDCFDSSGDPCPVDDTSPDYPVVTTTTTTPPAQIVVQEPNFTG